MDEINQQKPGKSEGSESFGWERRTSFRLVGKHQAAVIWGKSTQQKSNIK